MELSILEFSASIPEAENNCSETIIYVLNIPHIAHILPILSSSQLDLV